MTHSKNCKHKLTPSYQQQHKTGVKSIHSLSLIWQRYLFTPITEQFRWQQLVNYTSEMNKYKGTRNTSASECVIVICGRELEVYSTRRLSRHVLVVPSVSSHGCKWWVLCARLPSPAPAVTSCMFQLSNLSSLSLKWRLFGCFSCPECSLLDFTQIGLTWLFHWKL